MLDLESVSLPAAQTNQPLNSSSWWELPLMFSHCEETCIRFYFGVIKLQLNSPSWSQWEQRVLLCALDVPEAGGGGTLHVPHLTVYEVQTRVHYTLHTAIQTVVELKSFTKVPQCKNTSLQVKVLSAKSKVKSCRKASYKRKTNSSQIDFLCNLATEKQSIVIGWWWIYNQPLNRLKKKIVWCTWQLIHYNFH